MAPPNIYQLLVARVLGMFVNFISSSLCSNTGDVQDRTNIGNARVAGMQTSLAMSNYQVCRTCDPNNLFPY